MGGASLNGDDARSHRTDAGDPKALARAPSKGRTLVEAVRLIMVALFATAGWEIASDTGPNVARRVILGTALGSCVGFVVGGTFGRTTASAASALEREFRRIPVADILAGTIGSILGLAAGALLSVPLFHLPAAAALPTVAFVYFVCGVIGYRLGISKSDELWGLFGVKPRISGGSASGNLTVVDTSALVDGRIESLVRMGFVTGTLLVTRSVVAELQTIADSSDPAKRARGRRSLDLLVRLRRDPTIDIVLEDDEHAGSSEDVDAQLVRLARDRTGVLLTNDSNLARVAKALDVPVRSIDALAEALRAPVHPGERIEVRLIRPGRDAGQAVGYLDDGTMVVVESAASEVGRNREVIVTNVLQTASGRMVFAERPGQVDLPQVPAGSAVPPPGAEPSS